MSRRPTPRRPVATIIVAADSVPEQTLVEILDQLSERLAARKAAVAMSLVPAKRLTTELTVTGQDVVAALADAGQAAEEVLAALAELLGDGHGCTVIAVTVQTQEARQLQLDELELARDLVGIAEIAELRTEQTGKTVALQSASRSAQNPNFPAPWKKLKMGPAYRRIDVEDYFARLDARLRSTPAAAPIGSTPGLEHRTALAGLLRSAAENGDDLPESVADAAARPHALAGPVLASAIRVLGGSSVVARELGVAPRTVQRWVVGAEAQPGSLQGGSRAGAGAS